MAPHHLEWLRLWSSERLLLILAARGHAKTETLVVLPTLWICATLEDQLVYIISSTQDQANKILERVKVIIEREMPRLIDRARWATQEILTTTRVKIVAKGAANRIIGPHPQWIFVDDIIEDPQTVADSTIEEWFFASLFPMMSKDGRMLVVGTYKHFGDTYHAIEERGIFKVMKYPALLPDGKELWPEYWTIPMLEERRAALGNVLFAREYMLKPVDDSSSLFPMRLIANGFEDRPFAQSYSGERDVYVGVDPAASGEIGADYSVFMVEAHDPKTDRRDIINIIRARGVTLQAHVDILHSIEERYRPVHVKIEKNAFQRWLEQEAAKALRDVPITGHVTGKEKSDPRDGVAGLALLMERGLLSIPRGLSDEEKRAGVKAWESEAVKATDVLVQELNGMTWKAGKVESVAKHDDTVMALWLCNMAISEGKKERGIGMALVDTSASARGSITRASQIRNPRGRRFA